MALQSRFQLVLLLAFAVVVSRAEAATVLGSGSSVHDEFAQAAVLSDGTLIAGWGRISVSLRRVEANGQPTGSAFPASEFVDGPLSLIVPGASGYAVYWPLYFQGQTATVARQFGPAGPLGPEYMLDSSGLLPATALDGNPVLLGFEGFGATTLKARVVTPTGVLLTAISFEIADGIDTIGGFGGVTPSATVAGGRLVIVWEVFSLESAPEWWITRAAVFEADGTPVEAEIELRRDAERALRYEIAGSDDGTSALVTQFQGGDAVFQVLGVDGQPVGDPQSISSGNARPGVVAEPAGFFSIFWKDGDRIAGKRYQGTSVARDTYTAVQDPAIAIGIALPGGVATDDGRIYLTWQQYREDPWVADIMGALIDPVATSAGDTPAPARLAQNFPNPFNPSTSIAFDLPAAAVVDLAVFDASGRRVATLASGFHSAGRHELTWAGRDAGGRRVASGVYFYRLIGGGLTETRKMVLIK